MNNTLNQDFRKKLLKTDITSKKLNEASKKYKNMFLEDLKNKVIQTRTVQTCQCGSNKLEKLTKIDRFALPFGSLICKECGLILTSPRITQKSLPYYYDKYYHPLHIENFENQTALFKDGQGEKIFGILKDFLPKKDKIEVCEIGAGTGSVLYEFKKEAKNNNILVEELGCEYNKDCIEKSKAKGINTIFGDTKTIVSLNKKFDVIILSHVFEHFINLKQELNNLQKLMTDETLLYIEVPGVMVNHKKACYNFSLLGYLTHAHMYNFTASNLKYLLETNNLKVIFANEEIELICKIGRNTAFKKSNSYDKIINYLEFLHNNQDYFMKNTINNEVNLDFSIKINRLFNYVNSIKNSKDKIAIYGNGLVGNLIAKEIKDNLVVICDINPNNNKSDFAKVCLPQELENYDFDFLLISVLGREKEILESLNIDKNKILTINLIENAISDKNSKEFLENNLVGPFARQSNLALDEINIVFNYINKYIKKGIMIDVGAHFGDSAKIFLENNWQVFCYEPDPNNRKKLLENLKSYPNKTVFDKAISNKADELVAFYDSAESTGISGLLPFNKNHKKICEVQTSTLAKEIKENNIKNVDFLKIDTEGYDFMVLQGFPFDFMKPFIIECEFEDLKTTKLNYKVKDTINFLQDKGYFVYVSQWHPIVRYGIRHNWKRFFKYEGQNLSANSWGNLLAFSKEANEKTLVKLIKNYLNIK